MWTTPSNTKARGRRAPSCERENARCGVHHLHNRMMTRLFKPLAGVTLALALLYQAIIPFFYRAPSSGSVVKRLIFVYVPDDHEVNAGTQAEAQLYSLGTHVAGCDNTAFRRRLLRIVSAGESNFALGSSVADKRLIKYPYF